MALNPQSTPQRYPLTNPRTGALLTENQAKHLELIDEGAKHLFQALHFAEGSAMAGDNEENIFTTRRMNIAKTHIETALLFAREEVMNG
jgi:hypothetical protein